MAFSIFGVALVVLAAVLRLSLIETSRFTSDEALFYQKARHIAVGTEFPLLGPPVTGGEARHPGSLFYLAMSPAQLFTAAPEASNAMTALVSALSVGLFWWICRGLIGEWGAAFAGFMMAVSPWSLLYSDRIWNANLIPALTILCLALALRVRRDPRSKAIAPLILVLAVFPQFHLSAPVLWGTTLYLLGGSLRRLDWRWVVVGIALAVIAYSPYLASELQTGWRDLHALTHENYHHGRNAGFLGVLGYAFRFLTIDVSYHALAGYWGGFSERASLHALLHGSAVLPFSALRLFAVLCSFVLAALAIRAGFSLARRRGDAGRVARAAGLSVLLTMALLFMTAKPVYPHYVLITLPFLFVGYAALGERLRASSRLRWAVGALALVFCVGSLSEVWAISNRLDAKNGLATQRAVMGRIAADAARESWPGTTAVKLDLGFRGWTMSYEVLNEEVFHAPFRVLDNEGAPAPYQQHYVLREKTQPAPPRAIWAEEPMEIGNVILYRLRG